MGIKVSQKNFQNSAELHYSPYSKYFEMWFDYDRGNSATIWWKLYPKIDHFRKGVWRNVYFLNLIIKLPFVHIHLITKFHII